MKKQLLVLSLIFFLPSCIFNNSKKINSDRFGKIIADSIGSVNLEMAITNNIPRTIPIEISDKHIDMSNIIDNVRLTRLETSENCLIGQIDKLVFDGKHYYILDKNIGKTLLIFDNNGKFVKKVGGIGKGPGEYLAPTDFVVNDSEIILIDGIGHKIMYYSILGEYKNSVNLKFITKEIYLTKDNNVFILRMGDNRHIKEIDGYELVMINREGKILSKAINEGKNIPYSVAINGHFINQKTIYHRPLSNVIHEISDKTISAKYLLDFKGLGLPSDFLKICNGKFDVFAERYMEKYIYLLGAYIETDKYLIFRISNKNNPISLCIYNLDNNEIISGTPSMRGGGESFDLSGLISCSIKDEIFVHDNNIIGSISPISLNGLNNFPDQKKELINGDFSINENPIIFTLKLK